eukprot:SAG31_NODE_115_length_24128_cov_47.693912_15_plen_258_part_00
MAGLASNLLTVIALGLATEYWTAVFVRFLAGLLNCNLAFVKAYLGLITDKSNQAESMMYLAWAWGLGMMLAPVLGGALCKPAESYPWLAPDGSILKQYPYLLPSLLVAVVAGVGLVCSGFILHQDPEKVDFKQTNYAPVQLQINTMSADEEDDSEQTSLVHTDVPKSDANHLDIEGPRGPTYVSLLMQKGPALAILSYSLAATTMIVFSEMVPLYAKTELRIGGLGMGTAEIGLILGLAGVMAFVYQVNACLLHQPY